MCVIYIKFAYKCKKRNKLLYTRAENNCVVNIYNMYKKPLVARTTMKIEEVYKLRPGCLMSDADDADSNVQYVRSEREREREDGCSYMCWCLVE